MSASAKQIATREKLILAGLFLSKFDVSGLKTLGFESFVEAFNIIGYALGSKPASIKNYRDEFDPFFPNSRKGWHKRDLREYCRHVMEIYQGLDLQEFSDLVRSFAGYNDNAWSAMADMEGTTPQESGFAKRLMTGVAAENYFQQVLPSLEEFDGLASENTTLQGCGYDFRLQGAESSNFLAVEVKGLQSKTGSILFTPKEYDMAHTLSDRFYLFVVKNFREVPFHVIHRNPINAGLQFLRTERIIVQVSWASTV